MDGDPFSSPLTITHCVTLKLNDKNYLSWKFQFEQFLNSQSLFGYVNGSTPRPPPTLITHHEDQVIETPNPEHATWVRTDQRIMAWLVGSLSEDAIKNVYGLRSSQEVWFYLAQKYNRVSPTRKLELQSRIQATKKGGRSLGEYLSEIKSLCDQLDSIGAPLSEQEKIYGVLRGLGREYESISTVIENSMDVFPGPSYEDVVFKLIGFNDKLSTYESPTDVSMHQAFYTNRGGYSSLEEDKTEVVLVVAVVTPHKAVDFISKSVKALAGVRRLLTTGRHVRSATSLVIQLTNATNALIIHIKLRSITLLCLRCALNNTLKHQSKSGMLILERRLTSPTLPLSCRRLRRIQGVIQSWSGMVIIFR